MAIRRRAKSKAIPSMSTSPCRTWHRCSRAQQVGGLDTTVGDGGLPMGEIARRPWGEVSFYLNDPWGNPLCFVDETSIFRGPPA